VAENTPNAVQGSAPPPPPGFVPVDANPTSTAPAPPPGFQPIPETVNGQSRFPVTSVPVPPSGPTPEEKYYQTTPSDVVVGLGKDLLKTTAGVGELIHAIPGIGPALIPSEGLAAEEKLSEKTNLGEDIGGFAENVGEYATGDEILKGLGNVAKLEQLAKNSPIVAKIVENTPGLAKRILSSVTRTAKAGAVGGAQGAVKGAAEGGGDPTLVVAKAEEGAKSGAEGAALGSAAAETVGAVVKPVAKAVGLATTAEEDITRAAQPGKRNYRFLKDWSLAKDRIANEVEEGGKFKDMGEAADRIRDVRQNLWKDEIAPKIAVHANETFDTAPIANKVRNSISPQMLTHAPEEAKIMQQFADKYTSGTPNFTGARSVADAEKDLEFFNAELEKEGYWKKTPQERASLQKVDGKIASRAAAVDALRTGLYDHLEAAGETGIKDLKQTYGAIKNVENEIRGQVNVAGRQRPVSLKTIIGIASGHPVGIAASLLDRIYNAPEEILNRAVSKGGTPSMPKVVAQEAVKLGSAAAKKAAPVAGENLLRFIGSDGQVYFTPESKKEDVLKKDPAAKFQ
jgi:hypothetical protein